MGQVNDGIDKGIATFIGNLIWSTLAPAIIACAPPESYWITVFMVLIFSVGFALIGFSELITSTVGTLIGYGIVIAFISQVDIKSGIEMAVPYIGAIIIIYLKSKTERSE